MKFNYNAWGFVSDALLQLQYAFVWKTKFNKMYNIIQVGIRMDSISSNGRHKRLPIPIYLFILSITVNARRFR